MSFLDKFDKRAQQLPPVPGTGSPRSEDDQLLDFADLIRSHRAVPSAAERERVLQRVRMAELTAFERGRSVRRFWWGAAAAALFAMAVGLAALVKIVSGLHRQDMVACPGPMSSSNAVSPVQGNSTADDNFASTKFPAAVLASAEHTAAGVEVASSEPVARALRVHGLVVYRAKNEERWHVLKRGHALKPGDVVRTSARLESSARILASDGSAVSVGPGAILNYNGPRAWNLDDGAAIFEPAVRGDLPDFRAVTPDGSATAKGNRFFLEVSKRNANEPKKNQTLVRAEEGALEVAAANAQSRTLAARERAFLNSDGVVTADGGSGDTNWLKALENEMNSDHGIGQLVVKAEKLNEKLALEISSHTVTVTVVDQVARTFVDEIFENNTDRDLEGTFYYPLPPDAAISEFAMYVGDQRMTGEVLEQNKARQVFEYIVRQQKDPALLEWAGGNLFKMRVYPIPARSKKRVQLGYTQILPRRNGQVTYTYPLYSEMLLKNPLQKLNLEFRVLSTAGLTDLASPTHLSGVALDPDRRRGTLAFGAQKYSPTRDFSVSYKIPDGVECAAAGNTHPDDADPYFMLQLCPKATLPARKPPQRLLVIVDGSASAGAQDYAVATEFAASCADISTNWKYSLLRGGQNVDVLTVNTGEAPKVIDDSASATVRNFLASKPALGATDLLAIFQKAAELAADRKGLEIVYVGDGVDTLNEASGPALVEKITALFAGLNAHVSTVAIGSTYERLALQGIAAALGGTFTHVEGAADVHGAVDQVFDGFYRPQFWNARVKISGIETTEVHSELIGTLAAGDTAIVLGRFKGTQPKPQAPTSYNARVTFSADIEGGKFERAYDAQLVTGDETNAFIPRLWARAHAESLMAQNGLGTAADDTRIRNDVTNNSIKYQIMSPYTSFLVLETEEDYKRFDIKRTMKRVDFQPSDRLARKPRSNVTNYKTLDTLPEPLVSLAARQKRLSEDLFDGSSTVSLGFVSDFDGEEGFLGERSAGIAGRYSKDFFSASGPMSGEGLGLTEYAFEDMQAGDAFSTSLSAAKSKVTLFDTELESLSDWIEPSDEWAGRGTSARGGKQNAFFAQGLSDGYYRGDFKQGYSRGRGLGLGRYNQGRYFSSLVFTTDQSVQLGAAPVTPFEFKPDIPLKSAVHYQRLVARSPNDHAARLNWVLALEAEENYSRAAKELAPLLNEFPNSVELKLQQGLLLLRDAGPESKVPALRTQGFTRQEEGLAALNDALKAAGGDVKVRERIAVLLSNLGQNKAAAETYALLYSKAQNAEEAVKFGGGAANSWQAAGVTEKGAAIWEDMLKRWPDSGAVKIGAGQFMLQRKPKDERGLKLLREGASGNAKFGPALIYALIAAGQRDEAVATARKLLDAAPDQSSVYLILASIAQIRRAAIDESKRLLGGPCMPAQYAGVVQYWSTYSVKGDKEFSRLIAEGLKRTDLPPGALASAAYNLGNYSAGGMTFEKMAEIVKPLIAEFKTLEEFSVGSNVVNILNNNAKHALALEIATALLNNPALKDDQRKFVVLSEFQSLAALKREGEFFERHHAEFFSEKPTANEKDVAAVTDTVLRNLQSKGDLEGAAQRVAAFAASFPNSNALAALHSHVTQIVNQKKRDEREKALQDLAAKYPLDAFYADTRARAFAQKGKLREAVAAVRSVIDAQTPPPMAQRAPLINLLGHLSAQDAAMRDAFLKEAEERAKTQDTVLREWTEAALTCLHAAGDQDKYCTALLVLALIEPNDPEWFPRLGAALIEAGKMVEARAIYEGLAKAEPEDASLAFTLREICVRLKDDKAAQEWFDRGFELLAKRPAKLLQFASSVSSSNPEWALKAYTRLAQDPTQTLYSIAYYAGSLAHTLGRTEEEIDWYFKSLFAPESAYIHNAVSQLAQMAQQEKLLRMIEPRASAALKENPDASKAIAAHLLLHRLKNLKQDAAGARAELDAALKIDLPERNFSYLAAAIFEGLAADNRRDEIEQYAASGGGALDENQRMQIFRNAMSHVNGNKYRAAAIRMYRKVLESPESYNYDDDRRQLIEHLVAEGRIGEAEVVARNFDETSQSWSVWNAWQRVVSAYRAKSDFAKALSMAFEICERLKDDASYNANALRELSETVVQAQKATRLDAQDKQRAAAIFRAYAEQSFEGSQQHTHALDQVAQAAGAVGLTEEIEALAAKAENSGDAKRIVNAAYYMQRQKRWSDALRMFERARAVEKDNRRALMGIYEISSAHAVDWSKAFDAVNEIGRLKGEDEVWVLSTRVRCLEHLNKREEARKECRELLKNPRFLQQGVWQVRSLAHNIEQAQDYELATEIWEVAIRMLRREGRADPSNTSSFYTSCGNAYARSGNVGKALDCFLRGMSVIPRHDQHYKNVLNAALENVLSGKSLQQAVATHENNVAADGGDKPHLRLAFAEAFKRENKTREMLGQLRVVADLLPKDMKLRQEVIDGYTKLKDMDTVIDEYRRWSALDPQNIDLYRGWGDVYESMGRRSDALLAWATMAEIRPREAEGYRAYGQKLAALGENDKAAVAFRQAVKYRPTEFDIAKELADQYRKSNTPENSERVAKLWTAGEAASRKAMEDLNDDPLPWLNLGKFLEAQEKSKEARELYEKILLRPWPRFQRETTEEARNRLQGMK